MNSKALATAVGISLLFFLPVLAVTPVAAAPVVNGLDAAFWHGPTTGPNAGDGSFFGALTAPWSSCTTESGPPTSETTPTATEIDPNIAHGASTGFYWDESANGGGFTVGSTSFVNTDFSVEWTGYIWLTPGTYYFQLRSDDGSWLYINTAGGSTIPATPLLNDANPTNANGQGDGVQPPTTATSGAVTITTEGTNPYPIEVQYYETCDSQSGIDLSMSTTSATSGFNIIPTSYFTPAAIGSNAGFFGYPPSGVPQFGLAGPMVAAIGLMALVLMRKRTFGRIHTTA